MGCGTSQLQVAPSEGPEGGSNAASGAGAGGGVSSDGNGGKVAGGDALPDMEQRIAAGLEAQRVMNMPPTGGRERRGEIRAESYANARRQARASGFGGGLGHQFPKIEKSEEERIQILEALAHIFLFSKLSPEEKQMLVDAMDREKFPAGHEIVKQGDEGDMFYIIKSGRATVLVDGNEVNQLDKGDHFGELALLYATPRNATVRAAFPTQCFSLPRAVFRTIVVASSSKTAQENMHFLSRVKILKTALSKNQISMLAGALQEFEFNRGDSIVKQGDPGRVFYIIR